MSIQKFLNPKDVLQQIAIMPNSMIADFGAGTGKFAKIVAKDVLPDGKVFLIDIQKDVLGRVKNDFQEAGVKNAEFILSNLEERNGSKLRDKSVDLVIISAVLFQSLKKEEIIQEAVRVLRDSGRILIIEWKACFSGIGPDEDLIFQERQSLEMMKKYPVKLEKTLNAGDYHYAYLFRKH